MPNTKSAKKRLRQSQERRLRNRAVKSAIRNQIRRVRDAVKAGKLDEAQSELRLVTRRLDRAAAKNVVHRNAAARYKSRLSHLIVKAKETAGTA
jgi:small subunit ribosomal protein S20